MINRVFILFSFALFLISCDKEEKEAALIAEAVEVKKQVYKEELKQQCQLSLFVEADKIVDSLILEVNSTKNVLDKPEKPPRPEQPVVDFVDTIIIAEEQ